MTPLHIVVLDDENSILSSLSRLIKVLGHTCSTATRGEEVIALLESGLQPNLFILDIKIKGGMDGFETMHAIRERGLETPLLSMSGYDLQDISAQPGDLKQFIGHLEKPFSLQSLRPYLEAVTAKET